MNVRAELLPKPVDPLELKRVIQLIHAISDKHYDKNYEGIDELVAEYNQLTSSNHSVEDTQRFRFIENGMNIEDYAEIALRPIPKIPNVTDEEYLEIIAALSQKNMREAESSYWLFFLENNLASSKISDLIYWSKEELTPKQILAKAREWNPIILNPPGSSSE